MKTFLTLFASAALTLSAAAHAETPPSSLTEGFDDVTSLGDWVQAGSTGWFQGNTGIFSAQAGADTSYIAANFLIADPVTNVIDSWLISPEITLAGPTRLTFYTRDSAEEGFTDSLEVLFSAGAGTAASGFTTSLVSISGVAYPNGWTQYTADITGTGTGRFGFHYTGTYDEASYIGIDSIAIAAVPEPSTWLMLALGLGAVGFAARRSRRAAAGAGLALAALGMSQGAMAHEASKEATQQVTKDQGMVVVRDADTGALRAPTAEEYRALVPSAASAHARRTERGVSSAPRVEVSKNGTRKINVADKAVYSVVTRNADGSLTEACVTGADAANALVNNTRTAQAKEQRYEAQ
ncbi:choice-of-anchor J family PEP-CTERM protein [Pseudoduganella lutea]|uniref:PEP-CTERM sorting domain-containing protein n=1 Tax=Pseudoduganella lutea TaxID=321985 RepID=A0A4P6L3Q4_9BURK|nr:choice-of-anchor J domain-containing protein [Pseudoduganella lutea]QBE66171.1 PEP-CTERM sorting domain-containing protein [Pseudoduganella lutea]